MSRFRQHSRPEVPGLNLAALPDLIFTVLFFFMIVTHMRQIDPQVRYKVPQGTEVVKDDVNSSVFKALEENGIEIPFNYVNVVMK